MEHSTEQASDHDHKSLPRVRSQAAKLRTDLPNEVSPSGVRQGVIIGLLSGFAGITCCVSPVVLVFLGVVTAAEAVTLGDTLYYGYGWWFRGAGLVVGLIAVYLFLRRQRSCSLQGVRTYRKTLLLVPISAGVTYASLYWLTKYLGVWFG